MYDLLLGKLVKGQDSLRTVRAPLQRSSTETPEGGFLFKEETLFRRKLLVAVLLVSLNFGVELAVVELSWTLA